MMLRPCCEIQCHINHCQIHPRKHNRTLIILSTGFVIYTQKPSMCMSSNSRKAGSQLFHGNVKKILRLSAAYYFLLWPTEISDNPQANNMSKGTFWSRKMADNSGTEQNRSYFLREEAINVGVCYRVTLSVVEVVEWSLSTEKWWNETYRITLLYSEQRLAKCHFVR